MTLVFLDKFIKYEDAEVKTHRTERKAVGQERHDSAKGRAIHLAPSRNEIQHISIGHDSGAETMILLYQ